MDSMMGASELALLAKAHDSYVSATKVCGDWRLILAHDEVLDIDADQGALSRLIDCGMVARSGNRSDLIVGQAELFMATPKGESYLREVARARSLQVELTEFVPVEQATHLSCDAPALVPEYAQWRVLGDARDQAGRLIERAVTVAEVSFFHIGKGVLDASGYSIFEVFSETEMTLTGNPAEDDNGLPIDLYDLPESLGVPEASVGSILVIAEIKVFSGYLGAGIGAEVIQKLTQRVTPGGGIVLISPYPLSCIAGPLDISCSGLSDRMFAGLCEYYRGLGFKNHPAIDGVMVGDVEVIRFGANRPCGTQAIG